MTYEYFSHNGQVLPVGRAVIPLNNVEYAYGYGVYENIRAASGKPRFLDDHCQRLLESARIIGLEHKFSVEFIQNAVLELLDKLHVETANIKILLIGGKTDQEANLYILCLRPLFPDRKLYKTGAKVISRNFERPYPHAKSLNMLSSYLAYRDANREGAYDALLVDNNGNVTEGTRTNFFAIKDNTIYSAPSKDILLGVTRDKVMHVAESHGFNIKEIEVPYKSLGSYPGLFLTSTSSKIMPITQLDDTTYEIPDSLKKLMTAYSEFLDSLID